MAQHRQLLLGLTDGGEQEPAAHRLEGKLPALTLYTEASSAVGRVESAFRQRISALSERTRVLLTLAAAEGTGDVELVAAAAATLNLGLPDLAAAEDDALVRVGSGALHFRHPLVKAAAYRGAPLSARHAAHHALAAALHQSPAEDRDAAEDRRAHHLAAGTNGTDEDLGDLLEHAAIRALRRGAPEVAGPVFERAGRLSTSRATRARRLTQAAEAASAAGQLARCAELVARGLRLAEDPDTTARLIAVRAAVEFEHGDPGAAGRILIEAVAPIVPTAPDQAVALLGVAAGYAWFAGDGEAVRRCGRLAEQASRQGTDPPGGIRSVIHATEQLLSGGSATELGLLQTAMADLRAPGPAPADTVAATYSVFAALRTGADTEALAAAEELAGICRRQGRISELTHALQLQSQAHFFLGQFPAAEAAASEALNVAAAIGHSRRAGHVQGVLALTAAVQGYAERCEKLARSGIDGTLARARHEPATRSGCWLWVARTTGARPRNCPRWRPDRWVTR